MTFSFDTAAAQGAVIKVVVSVEVVAMPSTVWSTKVLQA